MAAFVLRSALSAAMLCVPGAIFAEDGKPTRAGGDHFAARSWEKRGRNACPKLDLLCRPVRWGDAVEFKAAAPRFQENAITLRFGARTERSPSKVEVQVGSFLKTALFVAALIAFIL